MCMERLRSSIYYLQELNYRLAYTLFGTALFFFLTYTYKQTLIYILLPKGISHFISTELTEIFITYLHLCSIFSLLLGFCIGLIQFYLFLRPGLYEYEAKKNLKLLYLTTCFYLCLYVLAFPSIIQFSWEFFSSYTENFTSIQLIFEPQLKNYLSHVRRLGLSLGLSYPFILILGVVLAYVKTITLAKYRGLVYIVTFSVAALLTPPDPISQILVGLPLILLYETQIACWLVYRKYQHRLIP
uniref:SecY-independent transporter protein n=1 Tax=Microzonia abyssicola TaxID=217214 RepID=UPI002E75B4E9|nr:SecY-independent transporter protein [Syringoderma abyssicola]WBP70363.1 SecY-independent transporter protein [Syringoderma abyssicola]